jgi:hypothetical protein
MSARRLHSSLAKAAMDAGESATHAAVTIAARWPIFAGYLAAPTAAALAEWNRAYAEKVAAVWEGALAASAECQAAMLRAAMRPPSAAALGNDLVRVAAKAAHPARKRVKANARRLTRRKKRG